MVKPDYFSFLDAGLLLEVDSSELVFLEHHTHAFLEEGDFIHE
jgi:hypothetical protein